MGQGIQPVSFEELLTGIKKSESKLLNLRVNAKCLYLKWEASKNDWQYNGESDATAWYAGRPGTKVRVDIHKMITPWEDGPAPFGQLRWSSAYNGKVGQSLSLEEGAPGNTMETMEGRITADVPFFLHGRTFYSGWSCSLYGCREQFSEPLSEYLEAAKKSTQVQCSVSAIRFDNTDCTKLVVELKSPGGELQTEVWYFDPLRGYAILFYENSMMKEQTTIDGLIEPAPGVFFPLKATSETRSESGVPEKKTLYEDSVVVANDPNFSNDIFTIKWPVGTTVKDQISGTTFIVGRSASGIGQAIGDQVKRIKAEVGHPLSPQPKATSGYWIATARLAAIVVTGGIVILPLWVARRRKVK